MAKRVLLHIDGEQIFPYVAPDDTFTKEGVAADAQAVGDKTMQVSTQMDGYVLHDNTSLQQYILNNAVPNGSTNGVMITNATGWSSLIFPVIEGKTYILYGRHFGAKSSSTKTTINYYKSNPSNGSVYNYFGINPENQDAVMFTIPEGISYIAVSVANTVDTTFNLFDYTSTIYIEEYTTIKYSYVVKGGNSMFTQDNIDSMALVKKVYNGDVTISNAEIQQYIFKNKIYDSTTDPEVKIVNNNLFDVLCLPVKPYNTYTILGKTWAAPSSTSNYNIVFYDKNPMSGNVPCLTGLNADFTVDDAIITIPNGAKYMVITVRNDNAQYDNTSTISVTYLDYDVVLVDKNGNIISAGQPSDTSSVVIASKTASIPDLGLPSDIPVVKITSALLSPNATNNTISPLTYDSTTWEAGAAVGSTSTEDVRLDFISNTINFTDYIKINYQGATSLGDAKKGFGIDTADKHKFGKWRPYDSFHLKAFYEDFIKCRDLTCNTLMEQVYRTRVSEERRPFMTYNDFGTSVSGFFSSDAYCHVDGFPIELYINDVYWGVYIWRTKKHRDNYMFNKSNTNHIFLDAQDFFTNGFQWSGVEIRNPKSDSGNTEFEEGVEPNDGEVKTAVTAWKNFMWGITSNTSKDDIEAHMNMADFIDVYLVLLVTNTWDSWARNTLYGSWDGQHFSPMVYDMNNSFNGFGGKNTGIYTAYYPPTSNTYNQKARSMTWFPILESKYSSEIKVRYRELKNAGVFTAENIIGIFEYYSNWVGQDAYAREAKRWPNCPSLIGTNRDIDSIANISNWIRQRIAFIDSILL